jgi:two-component system, chemotaxis family, response regulator Rcp1
VREETTENCKTILLVEDNLGDIRLIQEVLKESNLSHQLLAVRDGVAAMDFLFKRGEYTDVPRPDLIVLDLNLPKKDGREVLAEIKSNPDLKRIPVVVLSTSRNEEDIIQSYELHVNCYISKSRNLKELFKIVKDIETFWLSTVTLPS